MLPIFECLLVLCFQSMEFGPTLATYRQPGMPRWMKPPAIEAMNGKGSLEPINLGGASNSKDKRE